MELTTFKTWDEVLTHVAKGARLYYQAPADVRAHFVGAAICRVTKLRCVPSDPAADPFIADESHLDRFRRQA